MAELLEWWTLPDDEESASAPVPHTTMSMTRDGNDHYQGREDEEVERSARHGAAETPSERSRDGNGHYQGREVEEVAGRSEAELDGDAESEAIWPEHPFVCAWRRWLRSHGCAGSTVGVELWFAAARFRREVEARVSHLDLTLTQWLVLEATRQIIAEQRDATSQKQVAERLGMDKMTLSQVMRGLEARGLVDRGPSFVYPELRVWLTKQGDALLVRAQESFTDVSATASRGAAE